MIMVCCLCAVFVDVDGKTIHVVQRSPPSVQAASAGGASGSAAEAGAQGRGGERLRAEGNSFVVGSFSLPSDAHYPADVNQVHVSTAIVHCLH